MINKENRDDSSDGEIRLHLEKGFALLEMEQRLIAVLEASRDNASSAQLRTMLLRIHHEGHNKMTKALKLIDEARSPEASVKPEARPLI